jgi:hypothetical protein
MQVRYISDPLEPFVEYCGWKGHSKKARHKKLYHRGRVFPPDIWSRDV